MPLWTQHVLVILLAAGCLGFVARDAVRALGNKASRLAGCGGCKGCGSPAATRPADESAQRPVAFLPADLLSQSARRHARRG